MRSFLPLLLTLAACGSATAELGAPADGGATPTVAEAPGVRVETAIVQPTSAELDISLPGEVQGSRDALLGAAQGGFVEAVLVDNGDVVQKGQALARVNTRLYVAQRDQARARMQQAEDQVTRLEALGDLGAKAQIESARLDLAVAKAGADLADVQVARSIITAPFTGRVAQVGVEVGEITNPGSPVARVVLLDPVSVSVSISDKDIGALRPGMAVQVTADASGRPVQGTLSRIDPAADIRTRTFLGEIEVPNPDGRLLPGMIASVAIRQAVAQDTIIVPQDWLVTRIDGVGVFLVGAEGRAEWRAIVPGVVVRDQVVVESGLTEGDQVVTNGQRGLTDGDPLIIARTGRCCTHGRVTF
jgi:membrane fusion protein, multidrug efflux system